MTEAKRKRNSLIMEPKGLWQERLHYSLENVEMEDWVLSHAGPSGNSSLSDKVADSCRISLSLLEMVLGSVPLFEAQAGCVACP